jgi:hypothetical protein
MCAMPLAPPPLSTRPTFLRGWGISALTGDVPKTDRIAMIKMRCFMAFDSLVSANMVYFSKDNKKKKFFITFVPI